MSILTKETVEAAAGEYWAKNYGDNSMQQGFRDGAAWAEQEIMKRLGIAGLQVYGKDGERLI